MSKCPSASSASPSLAKKTPLVLASQSPRRRELLKLLSLSFEIVNADIDETPLSNEEPIQMVIRLAQAKARAIGKRGIDGLILAADTIVVQQNSLLGKPQNVRQAKHMLQRLRGRVHQVYSAIALWDSNSGSVWTDCCASDVWMRDYSDKEIADYVASGDPLDKAGAYAIQNTDFVEHLDGCFANVVGLPLCHLTRSLAFLGINLTVSTPTLCQKHFGHHCPIYREILDGVK